MAFFANHLSNKFGSCRHVANARDPHRGRDVKLYHIPGHFEVVGISDGTDCFVSPICIDPFSAGIARIFDDIRAGKEVGVRTIAVPRRAPPPAPPAPASAARERHAVRS